MLRKNFSDVEFWLFDLDNTIYSPETKIFDQIDIRMKKYISKLLNISQSEALKIQKIILQGIWNNFVRINEEL